MCPHGSAVSSEQECRKAATTIQKQFDHAWNGPNDFPGCLIANDGRDKVYWNLSPSPSETANNPQYGAICIQEDPEQRDCDWKLFAKPELTNDATTTKSNEEVEQKFSLDYQGNFVSLT